MSKEPFVSVIMPTRNEGRFIAACLTTLLRCSYPANRWEIIIADGMSADGTREEIARIAQSSPIPIRVYDNPRRVTPFALNIALRHARGDIILRVDAHSIYGDDYLTQCVQSLLKHNADNVGGLMVSTPGIDTTMASAIACAMMHPFGVGNAMFRVANTPMETDTVPYGCFRAEVFRECGLFDERLVRNQDYEFNQRMRRAGKKIYLDPSLEMRYYSRPTLRTLARQSWANGFWNALCHALHPYSICFRHVAPLLFSMGLLLAVGLLPWTLLGHPPGWLWPPTAVLWGLYTLYALLDLVVSTTIAARQGWRLWPSLVILFPIFHIANGLGLICGWTRALLHWYPWKAEDGIPTFAENQSKTDQHLAA